MPTYLPSGIRDELGALQFSNKSADDLAALDWEQRSLDDIGRIAPARAFSTPDAPVYEAPGQIQLSGPRRPAQPEQAPDWRPLNAQIAEQARQMNQQTTGGQAAPGTDPTTMSDRSQAAAAPAAASGVPQAMPSGGMSDEAWARREALRLGIDPQKAVDVGNTEGGFTQPGRQNMQGAPAYSSYQLYIGGPNNPGLGDEALAAGIDPRDPAQSKRAITYALEHAARNGWGAFQGAAANGIGNWDGIGGRPASSPTAAAPSAAAPSSSPAADSSRSAAGGWEVDQAALDDPDKWSLCGPVAAVMAATRRGGQWTVAQAKKIATESGLWNVNQGMGGLQTEVSLLNKLGVAAQTGAADLQHLTSDALAGNTPIISTVKHYFILKGYDPETGRFDTTTSGSVLPGGSRWLTLDQIEKLGDGIQGAAYIDNPSSPISSAVAGASDAYKLADTQTAPATGGLSPGDQKRQKMGLSGPEQMPGTISGPSDNATDPTMPSDYGSSLRTPGPLPIERQPDHVNDVNTEIRDRLNQQMYRQPLQATGGPDSTTGADPSSSYNDPTADGTLSQPLPSYTASGPDGGSAVVNPAEPSGGGGSGASVGSTPTPGTGEASLLQGSSAVEQAGASAPANDPGGAQFAAQDAYSTPAQPTRLPVWDANGNKIGYQQEEAAPPGRIHYPNERQLAPAAGADTGQVHGPEQPTAPPSRWSPDVQAALAGTSANPEPITPPQEQPVGPLQSAASSAGRSQFLNEPAAQQAVDIYSAIQELPFDAYARARQQLVSDVDARHMAGTDPLAPFRGLGIQLPSAEELNPDGRPASDVAAGLLLQGALPDPTDPIVETAFRAAGKTLGLTFRGVRAAGRAAAPAVERGAEAVAGVGRGIRGALDANAANVAAADARMAESGSTAAHGTLGVVTGNPLEANTAAGMRVIPPHVSDTLDFPVRVPTDPAVVKAIEAAGGSVDPNRGVNLNVIRMQGPEAAGKPATRSSTFYTAGKPGEASPYAGPAGAQTGGNERIEAPTTYRSPIVLKDPPGSNEGFNHGMEQLGAQVHPDIIQARQALREAEARYYDGKQRNPNSPEYREMRRAQAALVNAESANPPANGAQIDRQIQNARRAGPPGSPERAQALKDLVTRYGGDPGPIDDLVALRGGDDSESAWAIKENILAHNARAKGYDGVLTIGPRPVPEADLVAHPAVQKAAADEQAAWQAMEAANRDAKDVTRRYQARGMFPKPDAPTAQDVATARARADEAHQAVQSAQTAHTDARNAARAELGDHHISELADFRESHNPTPGDPNPGRTAAYAERDRLRQAYEDARQEYQGLKDSGARWNRRDVQAAGDRMVAAMDAVTAHNKVLDAADALPHVGEPGYTLRSDIPRRGGQTTASATAGVVPQGYGGSGKLGTVNRALGQGIASVASGGASAAAADQLGDPNDPNRQAKAFVAGALAPLAATRGVRAGLKAAGKLTEREGGALATFGASPNYRPPTPAQVQRAAQQGERRGQALNQTVKAPPSAVPIRVRAATQGTDDRAALRWAEDMLTDTAGTPRLRENDPARPSTQSRVNAGSVANERIDTELAPAVQDAATAGLQNDLPRFLEDIHHRDVLNGFYDRGHQALMDRRQPAIDAAKARGVAPAVIQRMEAKAAADADAAGTATMRQRQGSNAEHAYEATDARLQEQEQRLTADGRWQQLQDAAQAIWDHNAATRQRLVDSGNLDPQVAADLAAKYPHYVPTVPISHLTEGAGPVASSSTTVSRGTKPSISALEDVGTSGERLNPIVASRNSTVSAERDIQRNNVARAFARMMDDATLANPTATATSPATHRTFLGGGQDVHYREMGDLVTLNVPKAVADGLEAAANMGVSANGVTAMLKRVTGVVTSTLTAARASFVPVNVLRDASDYQTRTMVREGNNPTRLPAILGTWADEAGKAALDILAAQRNGRTAIGAATGFGAGALQGDENTPLSTRLVHGSEGAAAGALLLGANKVQTTGKAAEYLARGGGSGGAQGSLRAGQRWYRDVLRDGGAPLKSPADALRYLGDWAHDVASLQGVKGINERAETISRTAAMRRAEAQGIRGAVTTQYTTPGGNTIRSTRQNQRIGNMDPIEAMIAGRDSSYDADRAGTVTRAWNGFIPFLNATVQGGAQFSRMFANQSPAGRAATVGAIGATLGPVMLATEYYNRSDPTRAQAYDDVPQYVKDSGIVLMMPWAGSDTRGSKPNYLWQPTEVLTPFVVGMRAAMQHADAVVPGMQPSAGRSDANPNSVAPQALSALNEALSVFYPVRGDSAASLGSTFVPPVAKQAIELSQNKDMFRGGTISSPSQDERASGFAHTVAGAANSAGRALGNQTLQNVTPSHVDYLARQVPAYGDIVTGASDMVKPSPYKQAEQGRIANEPFVGGIASRFVRDTGGANLERAQGQTLNQQVQAILQSARMRPSEADLTVPADYKGANLTRDEMVRWQQQANIEIQSGITDALDSKQWDDPMTRSQAVKDAISKAKERAAKDALGLTPRDIKDRIEQQSILQRQAVGAR